MTVSEREGGTEMRTQTGTKSQKCEAAQRPLTVVNGTQDTPPHGDCSRCGRPAVFTHSLWRHVEATR